MKYPKIINELYGDKITVVQLVLTMQNSVEFVKNYDNKGIKLTGTKKERKRRLK